ncbi:hypothetical protein WLF18_07625 [Pseudomonas shirazensis]|uniref:Uncharacterized protein n=1 Tax=Pseudomonas shirazensis TaxID=2745494 RepID=A0ABU8ZXH0_9PSED
MQLDMYRDAVYGKYLIVEQRKDIKTLSIDDPDFIKGMEWIRTIDMDFDELPTGLDPVKVIELVKLQGYFKAVQNSYIREVEG